MKRVLCLGLVALFIIPCLAVTGFATEPVNDALYFDFIGVDYLLYELGADGDEVPFLHLSDVLLNAADFSNGFSMFLYYGNPLELEYFFISPDDVSDCVFFDPSGFAVIYDTFFVVPYDNFDLDGLLFPKAGIWFPASYLPSGVQAITLDFHGGRTFDSENTLFFMPTPDGAFYSSGVMTPGDYRVFISPDGGPLFTISQNATFSFAANEDGSISLDSEAITDYMAFPIPSLGPEAVSDGSPLMIGTIPIEAEGAFCVFVFLHESGTPGDPILLSENGYLLLEKITPPSLDQSGLLSSVITSDYLKGIFDDFVSLLPLLIPVMVGCIGLRKAVRWFIALLKQS